MRNTFTGLLNTVTVPNIYGSNVLWGGPPDIYADFNGDSISDLIVLPSAFFSGPPQSYQYFQGNKDGSYTLQNSSFISNLGIDFPRAVAVGDFDGDGQNEYILADQGVEVASNQPYAYGHIYMVNPNGSASNKITQLTDFLSFNHGITKGDFNGDGKLDVAVVAMGDKSSPTKNAFILLGDGNGGFVINTSLLPSDFINSYSKRFPSFGGVAAFDINGDGADEIIFGTYIQVAGSQTNLDGLLIYGRTLGSSSFQLMKDVPKPSFLDNNYGITSISSIDFDGDGDLDILTIFETAGGASHPLALYRNDGNYSFAEVTAEAGLKLDVTDSKMVREFSVADINLDGWMDVILNTWSYFGVNSFSQAIYLNNHGKFETPTNVLIQGNLQVLNPKLTAPQSAYDIGYSRLASQEQSSTFIVAGSSGYGSYYTTGTLKLNMIDDGGNEVLNGTKGNDKISGLNGNDVFFGDKGNDVLDGGMGIDVASYTANLSGYSVIIGLSTATVTDKTVNRDGLDTLVNIERLKFLDTMIALDNGFTQTAGSSYMLYKAAFNRTPDASGLGYWISKMDSGMSYSDVAKNFVTSAEFQTAFGGSNPSVNTLVTKLYNNVLNRAPDSGGLAFWQDKLNTGWSTADVLGFFSTSGENVTNVTPLIANGISYTQFVG